MIDLVTFKHLQAPSVLSCTLAFAVMTNAYDSFRPNVLLTTIKRGIEENI